MTLSPILVWFRQDLRLHDNPPLIHALDQRKPLIAVYIWSPEDEGIWEIGGASRWWLHHALTALQQALRAKGIKLIVQRGKAATVLKKIVSQTEAKEVVCNARYEPHAILQEKAVEKALEPLSCSVRTFHGNLLFEPGSIATAKGEPYQMFTPFYRACLNERILFSPLRSRHSVIPFHGNIKSLEIKELNLLPALNWDKEFYKVWKPGEKHAQQMLKRFIESSLSDYSSDRDLPAHLGTSRLSPHLHFGEVAPSTIWRMLSGLKHSEPFMRQLIWREFAHHLLIHFPKTPLHPLKKKFSDFPWKKNAHLLKKWQRGMTGFPLIDAGMRQLWITGWMHNRVRMIVASFLVKDLLIPWQAGAKWFWDTLVDADLANNTLGWQWCAGCGADAAPYFRIFNPLAQSKRFDPDGEYIRRYIPELKKLSSRWIHAPHLAPPEALEEAGVVLGETYPYPMVDHDAARKEALRLFHRWNSHS
jgi:deoxyribodipyrimidine photo-lyase